ncbi:MAG: ABC transporter substrate-binding protein [Cellulosilyticaceae bacterium]
MKKKIQILGLGIIMTVLSMGCSSQNTGVTPDIVPPVVEQGIEDIIDELDDFHEDKMETKIRLGVMSAVDAAPFYYAEEEGYFDALGLDVEIETFTNGATKQSSIQAGELDASMVSLVQFLNNKKNGLECRITTTTDGLFPVLLAPNFVEKKQVKVGLMELSVINYLADQYLTEYDMEKVYINEMPIRLQMLMANEIDMAILPEPLASQAQLKGLMKKTYGEPSDYTPNVIIFTEEFIDQNPSAVVAFHQAYSKAAKYLNENPREATEILIDELDLEKEIAPYMDLPHFHGTRLPSKQFVEDVRVWTEKLQGETIDLEYNDIVSNVEVQ